MDNTDIEKYKKIIEDHERRIGQLEKVFAHKKESVGKALSIKEFILSKTPSDDVQKTLLIAYYLEKFESMEFFNARDIEDGYRQAKESVPANINDKVNKCIRAGYMMESKQKKESHKAWCLTNTGEGFVENELKSD